MISDIRQLPEGSVLESDVCIVGGGAAAIAIARELAGADLRVAVLESGGLGLEADVQGLAAGTASGIPYFPLDESRYRMLGGSTYRWGARSAPMLPDDFEPRSWIAHSGWPLRFADLAPYYDRVEDLAGLHVPFDYDEKVWQGFATPPPSFDEDKLRFRAFQFGKIILFGEFYREMLRRAANVHVYLYGTVTRLVAARDGGRVEHAEVATLAGARVRARARAFVLAAGGIENARLLLLSDAGDGRGLCNEHDLVGRFFLEHPTVNAGTITTSEPERLHDVFSPGMVGGRLVETGLALAPPLQAERRCLQAITSTRLVAAADSTQALRELIWHARHRKLPRGARWYWRNPFLMERLPKVLRDPFGIVRNLVRHALGKPKRFKIESIYLEVRSEQEPNPESRVTLSSSLDALGLRRAHLEWRLTRSDRLTMQVAAETFAGEIERLGLGRLQRARWLEGDEVAWSPEMVGGHHHMGTTRMAADPEQGVVDRDCRAHAVDNLYFAGSSVFPTASFVNPTQTLLALAVRLADHLRERLA